MPIEFVEILKVTNRLQLQIATLQQENAALKKELEEMRKDREKGKTDG